MTNRSWILIKSVFFTALVLALILLHSAKAERIDILMSNVTTQKEDAYICTSYKLNEDHQYISNIQPIASANIVHHMFAFGCEKPASMSNSWNCESLVCQGSKTIVYAWGRNAPALQLPDDVAFKVGPKTNFKYIVVNIHYLTKVNNDKSGLTITVGDTPKKYEAGIMLLVTGNINLPPNTKKYSTSFSCKYTSRPVQVFAFRVHAHASGEVNTAYRVRQHEWTRIAKGDPQWPQAFYPTETAFDLKDGDTLVGSCTYHNDQNRYIYAGGTHNDEMCNIYLMFYAENIEDVMRMCSGSAYPQLESVIPEEASVRPPAPSNFNGINDNSQDKTNVNSHHDMEGTKLHHDISNANNNDLSNSNLKSNSNKLSDKGLSYFLAQAGLADLGSDDYYDDVERSRSKNRNSPEEANGAGGQDTIDDAQSQQGLFDPNTLLDAALSGVDSGSSSGSSSSSNGDDYSSLTDSSILLAAELAKLNKKLASGNSNNNNNNQIINKMKNKLNNLIPPTITISKYTNVENWYDVKAAKLGQIGGIELNQKNDNIVVFHRGSQVWQADSFNEEFRFNTRKYTIIPEDTIVVMNRYTGKVVNSWGANQFYMPHGLTIDSEDNVWVTDVGRHQVLKFAPNKKEPVLEIGERMVPGNDKKHLCQPADIAVLKNGDFFVADGYCNSRIVKFSKNGEYLSEWSSEDEKMPAHFFLPHSLALNEAKNLLCVADRENYRVQCFDLNGNFLQQSLYNDYGPIYSVAFAANNASTLFAINGFNSRQDQQFDKKIFLISTVNGNIQGSINLLTDIRTPHDLALSDDASEIYIGNLNPPLVFKYVLVNYNLNKIQDKRKMGSKKDSIDGDKENFRTSMFIMAFLIVPLVLVVVISAIVRLRNMGKLKRLKLATLSNGLDAKQKEIGRWIKEKSNKRNGFTRLNQESENEEAESLTSKPRRSSSNRDNSDYESESEPEVQTMPTLSKA